MVVPADDFTSRGSPRTAKTSTSLDRKDGIFIFITAVVHRVSRLIRGLTREVTHGGDKHRLFWSKSAEITIVGLQVRAALSLFKLDTKQCQQASGKTSFVNVIGSGQVRSAYSCPQPYGPAHSSYASGVKTSYRQLHFISAKYGGAMLHSKSGILQVRFVNEMLEYVS